MEVDKIYGGGTVYLSEGGTVPGEELRHSTVEISSQVLVLGEWGF